MKKILMLTAAAAAIFASCTREDVNSGAPVFRGVTENVSTRTALSPSGDGYSLVWSEGDVIAVSNGTETASYKAARGGSTETDFTIVTPGSFSGSAFTAYYPASLAEGILPAVQKYAGADIVEAPMMAETASDVNTLEFRLLGGMMKINVSTALSGVKVSSIVLSSDQGFSGPCVVEGGLVAVDPGQGSDVTLDCGEGVEIGTSATPFVISVPVARYTGLTVSILTTDGKQSVAKLAANSSYSIKRGEMRTLDINVTALEPYFKEGKALLMMGSDFSEVLKRFKNPSAKGIDKDKSIKKIIFRTNDPTVGPEKVSAYDSEIPIYASWDSKTGTVTVTTAASEITANESLSYTFAFMHALKTIEGLTCFNTSGTKFFDRMFFMNGSENPQIEAIDCSSFNTEKAISMQAMFDSCQLAKVIDVSSFRTPNVESFSSMFCMCKAVEHLDVSHFDTSKGIKFGYMFCKCNALQELDVSNFNTANATTMDNMFSDCWLIPNLDLSGFNTDKVTSTRSMFNRCKAIRTLDIRHMSFPATTLMTYMFYQMEKLETLHIESLDFARWSDAASLEQMFRYMPCLKEIYLGEKGCCTAGILPTSFFASSTDKVGVRTASYSKELTIHCTKQTADWLAKTSLRWIKSGYSGFAPIDVKFIDLDGNPYTPTWPAD
ncbi:MAG: DUF285 domain-containing protein [Bacteroidales bacterium]|nr:DUF285 domain-containing protein [Bacteroidales bacterium]